MPGMLATILPRRRSINLPRAGAWLALGLMLAVAGCATDRSFQPGPEHLHRHDIPVRPLDVLPDSLLVVSYNIQFGRNLAQAVDDLRLAGLDRPDILLLQEMTPEGVDTLAATLGLHARYQPASIHRSHGLPFGNAVLSRWPITATGLAVLPHPSPLDGRQRIALSCDLDLAGRSLRVVCLHLETVVLDQRSRLDQAAAALDLLVDDWSGPLIVGGDFNLATAAGLNAGRRLYRRQARLRPVDLGPDCTIGWHVGRLLGLGCQLDQLFYRGLAPGSAGVATGAAASDHLPVWARFGWPDAGPLRPPRGSG